MNTLSRVRFIAKPIVFILCLIPILHAVGDVYGITGSLGANPIENLQDRFGNWGLRFILIALAVTPLRKLTGWNWLLRFRRMLGLFAFFYVLLHFVVWLVLDRGLAFGPAWGYVFEDIFERPFITIGFAALLILVSLAATSTAGMRRRLGRTWQKLHNWVYVAAILGVWHYWWQVKLDASDPAIYATILALLLGYRIWQRKKAAKAPA
ncbi:MAG: sulfoxide reductase heme-binding subunit YedZ [Gammaproteobacteria bacterium]|nr:sulfoxide reductase heme-binding subunit YedZ [Gammaproteobacteria bacterium]